MADSVKFDDGSIYTPPKSDQDTKTVDFGDGNKYTPDVYLVAPNGEVFSGPQDKSADLISQGWREASKQEIATSEAKKRTENSTTDLIDSNLAAGEALLRPITFGASDWARLKGEELAGGDPEQLRREMKARQEAHPLISTASEIAGFFTPSGAESKVVSTVGKGLGELAERAALNYVEKSGTGLAARKFVQKAIKTGVENAGEMAVMGARHNITENILGDPNEVGENIAYSVLRDGGIGFLIGAPASLLMSSLKGMGDVAGKIAKRVTTADGFAQKASDAALDKAYNIERGVYKKELKEEASKWGTDFVSSADERVAAQRKNAGIILDDTGNISGYGEPTLKALSSPETLWGNTVAQSRKVGEEIGGIYNTVKDKIAKPNLLQDSYNVAKKNLVGSIDPEAKTALKKFEELELNINNKYGTLSSNVDGQNVYNNSKLNLKSLWDIRKELDQIVDPNKWFGETTPYTEAVKQLRVSIDKSMKESLKDVLDVKTFDSLQSLNKEYRANMSIMDSVRAGVAKDLKNRSLIPTKLEQYTAIMGSIMANPLAAGIGLAGKKVLDKYGDASVALFLDQKSPLLVGINNLFDTNKQLVSEGVKNFFQKSGRVITSAPFQYKAINLLTGQESDDQKQTFKDNYRTLQQIKSNPEKLLNNTDAAFRELNQAAPNATGAAMQSLMSGVNFLMAKLPQVRANGPLDNPNEVKLPSDLDMAKFNRYVRAVFNPRSVVDGLNSGTVSPEAIEALKNVYPTIYQSVVTEVMDQIADNPQKFSYKDQLNLSSLLGVTLSEFTSPEFFGAMQKQYIGENQQEQAQGQAPSKPMRKVDFDIKDRLTQQQRVEYK